MNSIRIPRGDACTFLTHLFGGGLDEERYPSVSPACREEMARIATRRRRTVVPRMQCIIKGLESAL